MKISTIAKIAFIALTVIFIAYVSYAKLQPLNAKKKQFAEQNSTLESNPKIALKDSIVAFGMEYLGTPYTAGGCSKDGFDCSGFVYFVYQHFNIEVPRSSSGFNNFGKEIPIDKVEKGDLLLFLSPTRDVIGHVGIVSNAKGMKSDFIHSTSGREMKVVITNLSNEGYTRRFVKAVRVL